MKEKPRTQLETPARRSCSVNFLGKSTVASAVANGGTMPPTMTAAIKPAAAVECGSFAKAPDAKTYAALLKGPPMSMDIMPVFIKAGTILPFGPEVQYSSEKPWDELEIRVYPGADGSFTLYEDEGDNYNYEKGKFSEIRFVWNEADRTLSIAPRKGSYKGMLQHRRFHIVLVDANSGAGDQPMQASKSVEYDGKAVKIQL